MKLKDDGVGKKGAGRFWVADPSRPDDVFGWQMAGEAFPRLIVVPDSNGAARIFRGNGAAYPTTEYSGTAATIVVSRLIQKGHSYASEHANSPYGNTAIFNGDQPRDGSSFTALMRDAASGGHRRWIESNVPAVAAGATVSTLVGMIPEDCVIEGVWYLPAAALVGANTNTRRHEIQQFGIFGFATFAQRQYDSGTDLTAAVAQAIYSPTLAAGDDTLRQRNSAGLPLALPLWTPSYYYPLVGPSPVANALMWVSSAVGTGIADPGGKIIVRLGGRYRNTATDGALLARPGVYGSGWGAAFAQHRAPIAYGIEVCATAASGINASPLTVTAMPAILPSGWVIRFSGGAVCTTTAPTALGSGSVAVGNHAAIVAGEQGFATPGVTNGYDAYQAEGVFAWLIGLNDVGAPDRPMWRELVRSMIALDSCPFLAGGQMGNHVTVNGNGAAAAWALFTQPPAGQWLVPSSVIAASSALRFTGAVGATPPTLTIRTAPAFQGGTIDLFFAAMGGTARGARASIVADGGSAKIVDTSGGFVSGGFFPLVQALPNITTAAGSPTVTGSGFSSAMVGRVIEAASIPKGRIIYSVESAGSLTISDGIATSNGTGVTLAASTPANVVSYCPMVKRLTGLAPGAHTIVVTVTGIDATDGSASLIYMGYGLEVDTPVHWANVAQIPSNPTDVNVTNMNLDTVNVIGGLAAAPGTGTIEPAFPSTVQVVDIDSALAANLSYFMGDGKHPNAVGVSLMEQAFAAKIATLTASQLLAR